LAAHPPHVVHPPGEGRDIVANLVATQHLLDGGV